ncbi:phosphopantetheine-binding protein [Undibacterium sp. RuRC25W]|uniref:phosphopantetheine-binding protein n=1 Tax=Undibacterium sp. RuRC25W TaxID=3413047 RepID=UPI003BF2D7C9
MINTRWTKESILQYVKQDLLLDRLELAEMGLTLEKISDDALLLDESELGLDSVDVLDLLVGIERKFGFKFEEINKKFIEETCISLGRLTNYIMIRLQQSNHEFA